MKGEGLVRRLGLGRPIDRRRVSVWERIVAAVGAVLVTGAVSFMIYDGITGTSEPPSIRFETEPAVERDGVYLVRFTARNTGDLTASNLEVVARLTDASGAAVETGRTLLDFLPGRSERAGGVFFSRDPAGYILTVTAAGYEEP